MDLQALLDEREIERGLSRFARILDGKQWDSLADVFAADVTFDYGSGEIKQGIEALRSMMRRYFGSLWSLTAPDRQHHRRCARR